MSELACYLSGHDFCVRRSWIQTVPPIPIKKGVHQHPLSVKLGFYLLNLFAPPKIFAPSLNPCSLS
jgi:hypothetical protein